MADAVATAATNQNVAVPVNAEPQFALAPSLLPQASGFIDYATREGQKLYSAATAPLNEDEKFDGKGENISLFKESLKSRVREAGWANDISNIIDIPITEEGGNATSKNLITEYGLISKVKITEWAQTNVLNQQTRLAQNNYNMYECLEKSISSDLKKQMISEIENCEVSGQKIAALLFKLIMTKCEIDTKATISSIRMSLMNLDSTIQGAGINNNITKFNSYVNDKIKALQSRGETSSDLIIYLFKAYKSVKDSSFVDFIKKKEDEYLHDLDDNLTHDKLMQMAELDYKIRFERKTWGALSEDQQKIVALNNEIKLLKATKKKKGGKSDDPPGNNNNKSPNSGNNGGKKSKKKKGTNDSTWEWKKVPPSEGETSKNFEGKTYFYCPKHKAWCLHKPSECRKGATNSGENHDSSSKNKAVYESSMATIEEGGWSSDQE